MEHEDPGPGPIPRPESADLAGGQLGSTGPSMVSPLRGVATIERVRSLLEVLICSGFPTQLAISGVLALGGVYPLDRAGRLSAPYVYILSLADSIALVGLVLWFLCSRGERPVAVLLGRRRLRRECLVGLALIPVAFAVVVVILSSVQGLAPGLHNVARNPFAGLIRSPLSGLMLAFVTVVSGGFREEIQRAFILHRFEQHLGGSAVGLVLFSIVFGLGHAIQGWDVAATVAALGVLWGLVYLRRRSIAASVVSHAGFDVVQVFRYTFWGA